jgi:hypothetical protein
MFQGHFKQHIVIVAVLGSHVTFPLRADQ